MSSVELSDMIHEFHRSPARTLYPRYAHGELAWAAASALARGVLDRAEAPSEVLELLATEIAFCERGE